MPDYTSKDDAINDAMKSVDKSMAATSNNAGEKDEPDNELIARALALYKTDYEHWNPIYDKGRNDLDFLSDEDGAQWPDKEYAARTAAGRPTLTNDYLSQFVHQVANNIRMNTPSINPIPAGGGADIEAAKILKGAIRSIEYASRADAAYDTAATSAVKCSIGFVLVDHDFVNDGEDNFNQVLQIKRVVNPFMIFMDSCTIESDGSDQDHGFILEKIKVSTFKKEFPDADICSWEGDYDDGKKYDDNDEIVIAQFFDKIETRVTKEATNDYGRVVKKTVKKYVINRYKMTSREVLERTTFPGEYIPIIPFYGEEAWNDGKRFLHSLIRKAKQSQYMLNLSESTKAEILNKQPIAPVMVASSSIENYADDWLHPEKSMALRYDTVGDQGEELPAPQRLNPPVMSSGFANQTIDSINNIKATMGLYNNSLGEKGQETSGVAINAKKIQGEVSTYHFGDNTVRAITQVGKVCVSAYPEIYDVARVIQIMDEEDKPKEIGINGELVEGQEKTFDLNKGKYGVRVVTGASFTTMRQESAAFYQDMAKTNPESLMIMGDLMFENMDVAGAPAMASRMKKLIQKQNPDFYEEEGQSQDPQVQILEQKLQQAGQIIQQGLQQIQQMEQELQDKNAAVDAKRATDQEKNQIDMMKIALEKEKQKTNTILEVMKLTLQAQSLEITEEKNAGDLAIKTQGQNVDALMQTIDKLMAADAAEQQQTELPMGNMSANDGGIQNGELNV